MPVGVESRPPIKVEREGPERIDQEKAEEIKKFILDLANEPNVPEEIAIKTIVDKIRELENYQHFALVLRSIDPDGYSSETKILTNEGRDRLNKAIEGYKPTGNK